ncbi:glycosyltransferase family 39 protein [Ancylomarina sp. 16SWW S1-10-2]|uniref:ArnT family glycosyltransferase n=1 Tax=Ancylomarina sp. 16SWW S1-10-2 TaxID=2499681 RepID=UPI0012AD7028|nr:glycosyltransferase family 39 protein [Ancylomarina sp. 16SWW S1-10-2]MRT92556.1 phospholipid carrier-dependent glycosyltransferase [Ancylomarina sp. 16SWW S1-10-2]
MQNKHAIYLSLLLVVSFFAFFIMPESFYVNIMEARNFVTARDMIEKGNWLVPTMNGELRLAKPPFPTWITGLFGLWFGKENIGMLRFPAGIMGTLMVFFAYLLSFELHKKKDLAFTTAFVLATSFYVFYTGRTGTWDIYCHSFMLGAIWLLVKGWQKEGQNWLIFLGASSMLGLSFLSKGPVSFYSVFLPFLIVYITLYGSKQVAIKWKALLLGIFLFLIISFWWPIYIYIMHPVELAAISKLETGSWINRHVRPFWYYWNFPIQSGIWTLFITTALLFPYGLKRFKENKGYKLALFWTIGSVVLLSLLPEKKDRYLLPVLLPSAFMVAYYLNHLSLVFKENKADKWDKLLFGINIGLIAFVAFVLPFGLYQFLYRPGYMSMFSLVLISLLIEFVCAILLWGWKKRHISTLLLGIGLLMGATQAFVLPSVGKLANQNPKFKNIREVRTLDSVQGLNFYSIGKEGFRIELVWEVGQDVKQWNFEKDANLPEDKAFVVFSTYKPEEILPQEIKNQVDIEVLDYFDYNRSKKSKVRFTKYVSIIKPKH